MYHGRLYVFKCDFCDEVFRRAQPGLPEGMKWVPGHGNEPIRHICAVCIGHGKGRHLPLKSSGQVA
jgi:hypothetical protein